MPPESSTRKTTRKKDPRAIAAQLESIPRGSKRFAQTEIFARIHATSSRTRGSMLMLRSCNSETARKQSSDHRREVAPRRMHSEESCGSSYKSRVTRRNIDRHSSQFRKKLDSTRKYSRSFRQSRRSLKIPVFAGPGACLPTLAIEVHRACLCAQSHSCRYHSFDDTCMRWVRSFSFGCERLAGGRATRNGDIEAQRVRRTRATMKRSRCIRGLRACGSQSSVHIGFPRRGFAFAHQPHSSPHPCSASRTVTAACVCHSTLQFGRGAMRAADCARKSRDGTTAHSRRGPKARR